MPVLYPDAATWDLIDRWTDQAGNAGERFGVMDLPHRGGYRRAGRVSLVAGAPRAALDLHHAPASTFSEYLHHTFRLRHGPAVTDLELIDVADGSTGRHVSFSLMLCGPQQPIFPQQIYPFEHDRLGRFDLFIVPIKRDAHGPYYEAVVHRAVVTVAAVEARLLLVHAIP